MFISRKKLEGILDRLERIERHLVRGHKLMLTKSGEVIPDPEGYFGRSSVCSYGEEGVGVDTDELVAAIIKKGKLKIKPRVFLEQGVIELK